MKMYGKVVKGTIASQVHNAPVTFKELHILT
jgi:hypothetical protein